MKSPQALRRRRLGAAKSRQRNELKAAERRSVLIEALEHLERQNPGAVHKRGLAKFLMKDYVARCREAGIKPPHPKSVANWIAELRGLTLPRLP